MGVQLCKGSVRFPALARRRGSCFLADGSPGLSSGFPIRRDRHLCRRGSGNRVKHLSSIFQTKKELVSPPVHCSPAPPLIHHPLHPFDLSSRTNSLSSDRIRSLEPGGGGGGSFMVFFHPRDAYGAAVGYQAHLSASVSSLFLFSFLPSANPASLSGARTHAPCHVLYPEQQRCDPDVARDRCEASSGFCPFTKIFFSITVSLRTKGCRETVNPGCYPRPSRHLERAVNQISGTALTPDGARRWLSGPVRQAPS